MKTGPSRAHAQQQCAAGMHAGDRHGPGGPAHSAGAAGSMRGDSRSALHGDTAARSIGVRDSMTRRSQTAPSTARTSADTGPPRLSARPKVLPANGQADQTVRCSPRQSACRTLPRPARYPPGLFIRRESQYPISPRARRRGFAADDDGILRTGYTSESRGSRPPFTLPA